MAGYNTFAPSQFSKELSVNNWENYAAERFNTIHRPTYRFKKISDDAVKKAFDAYLQQQGANYKNPKPNKKQIIEIIDQWIVSIKPMFANKSGFEKTKTTRKSTKTTKPQIAPGAERNENGILINEIKAPSRQFHTEYHETLSAYMILFMSQHPHEKFENITQDKLLKYKHRVISSTNLEDCYNTLGLKWFKSSYEHGKKLATLNKINNNHIIHRDDDLPWSKQLKKMAEKELALSNIHVNFNKWNTADLWIIQPNTKLEDYFVGNIHESNSKLIQGFYENKIIGVSLKGTGGKAANIQLSNIKKENKIQYDITEITSATVTNKKGTFVFTNYNTTFQLTHNKLPTLGLSSKSSWSNGTTQWAANIHHGAGGGDMRFTRTEKIFKELNVRIPSISEAASLASKIKEGKTEEFIKLVKTLDNKYDAENLQQDINQATDHRIINKIYIMLIMSEIAKLKEDTRKTLISSIFYMTSAQNEWAGPYIKLY